jgi:hypothetical protein
MNSSRIFLLLTVYIFLRSSIRKVEATNESHHAPTITSIIKTVRSELVERSVKVPNAGKLDQNLTPRKEEG